MNYPEKPIHINAPIGGVSSGVLMPGDPLRAKYIAENFLEDAKEICNVRNMLGYTGIYKGKKVSVIGSGMGMPSMGIYSFELFHYYDVKKIIRIGTCGVLNPIVNIPDIILASSSYSESNFAYSFNNFEGKVTYPSSSLNEIIINTAKELNYHLHVGNISSTDVFGPYLNNSYILERNPKDMNILGEEMESFALFHVAKHLKKEAACLLTATDSKFSDVFLTSEERVTNLNKMIELALESIIK